MRDTPTQGKIDIERNEGNTDAAEREREENYQYTVLVDLLFLVLDAVIGVSRREVNSRSDSSGAPLHPAQPLSRPPLLIFPHSFHPPLSVWVQA